MSRAHRRKKNPKRVRADLIESAKNLAKQNGLENVGLEAVAAEAGVTKGGLLHHFSNKGMLVESVFQHLLDDLESSLEQSISADKWEEGRFTRAYIQLVFEDGSETRWGALWLATLTSSELRRTWGRWFNAKVAKYNETDPQLELARFAADGVWLGRMCGVLPNESMALKDHLIHLTRVHK